MVKKQIIFIVVLSFAVTIALTGCGVNNSMVFEVSIPQNTPATDIIYLHFLGPNGDSKKRMEFVDDYVARATLTADDLGDDKENIQYRYSRNGYNFNTAEYLEPDTNDYFWESKGRSVNFRAGDTQIDRVERWRWFPPDGNEIVRTSDIEPGVAFLPRVNGAEFRSGQVIEDLYVPVFSEHFDTTAEHMADIGYKWAIIDPPWQWAEDESGLPRVENQCEEAPNYPDDETLIAHIQAFKDQGLNVMLGPQICCTVQDTEGRSDEWWDAWFEQVEKFLAHHAEVGETAGADAFFYAVGSEYKGSDAGTRWRKVFIAVREKFSGEVGLMVWNHYDNGRQGIFPEASSLDWAGDMDFFYVHLDAPVTFVTDPTDAELKAGAGEVIDATKSLHDRFDKPVFLQTTYFNVKDTWRGSEFYDITSIGDTVEEERGWQKATYEFSTRDLARLTNAYFEAIAERPWVLGLAQFGYGHWEMPLSPWLSIRGKPAEDVWRKWNKVIYDIL